MYAILMLAVMVSDQCGPNGCPIPAVVRPYFVIKVYSVTHQGLTFNVKGYKKPDGSISWNPTEPFNVQSLRDAKAKNESEPRPWAKIGPPPESGNVGQAVNFGMEPGRMTIGGTPYHADTPEARRFVAEATQGGPDHRLHVTVIGSDDQRANVVRDLGSHPAFADMRSTLMVQDYRPNEWPVEPSLGFVTTGKPTILVQTARSPTDPKGGKVILRTSDYAMGPEGLAEAIRKVDPNYRPASDPTPIDLTPLVSSAVCPLGFTKDHWPHILAVGIGTVLLHRLPRKGA